MSVDIAALRTSALLHFKALAEKYFAANPETLSLVMAVAQYWADEADDAVHAELVAYPTREPWWPHECGREERPGDGAYCNGCLARGGEGLWLRSLASNDAGVFAWAAFCSESGANQEQGSEQFDPLAIARRAEDGSGEVELEEVYEVVRPWLDRKTWVSNAVRTGGTLATRHRRPSQAVCPGHRESVSCSMRCCSARSTMGHGRC